MTDERIERLREALDDLQQAEANYRLTHDSQGERHTATGRAWDLMRRAGDKARATLSIFPTTPSEGDGAGEEECSCDLPDPDRATTRCIKCGQTLSPRPPVDVEGLVEHLTNATLAAAEDELTFRAAEKVARAVLAEMRALRQPPLPDYGDEITSEQHGAIRALAAVEPALPEKGEDYWLRAIERLEAQVALEREIYRKAVFGDTALSPKPEGMGKALEELRELSEQATAGEWLQGTGSGGGATTYVYENDGAGQQCRAIAAFTHDFVERLFREREANAALAAAAVNFVRTALAANPEKRDG
jgi:hypothetical protein